eukprot:6613128-Pyramimonas_sp.AAC.1
MAALASFAEILPEGSPLLSPEESVAHVESVRAVLEQSRSGEKIGETGDFFQLPMSHIMSFPILDIFTAIAHCKTGLEFLDRRLDAVSMEWEMALEESLQVFSPASATLDVGECAIRVVDR